jgi:uncharacterized protein YndB with AHSA1/START domain
MSTDRIEKQLLLHAPLARVWRALSDSKEFGHWFGMRINGPFVQGATMTCVIVPTAVNPEVAKAQKPYEGISFEITIVEIQPQRRFSFRWHPGGVEPGIDYSVEPTTLVVFELQEVKEGVQLTMTESGFDQIPLSRRAKAFKDNEGGWTMVMTLIEEYLGQNPQ